MLTFFSIPKPFKGHIEVIQRNAIQSWLQLRPACEIVLLGDDEGTAEVASEFGLRHITEVASNDYGTPLVNDIFAKAEHFASNDLLCYVNADIILLSDFLPAVKQVAGRRRRFLMVGQRWDMDLKDPLDFTSRNWEAHLRRRLDDEAVLHPRSGIDYFVFPLGLWGSIPAFAIGRTTWDNWLLYRARQRGAAVIDATQAITAVHQNHHYGHIPNGIEGAWKGLEATRNRELAGGHGRIFTLLDANWLLAAQGLRRAQSVEYFRRALTTWPILHPHLRVPFAGARWLLSVSNRASAALPHHTRRLHGRKKREL